MGGQVLQKMTRNVGTSQEAEEAAGIIEDEAVEQAAAAEEAEEPPAEVVVPKGANTSDFLLVKELAVIAMQHIRVPSDLDVFRLQLSGMGCLDSSCMQLVSNGCTGMTVLLVWVYNLYSFRV